jgi:hypothetical protein
MIKSQLIIMSKLGHVLHLHIARSYQGADDAPQMHKQGNYYYVGVLKQGGGTESCCWN